MILVLKMTKKYTHNMILVSRYKGQLHGGKRANKFGRGPPPPYLGNARKKSFFPCEVFLNLAHVLRCCCVFSSFVLHQNADCVTICLAAFWGEAGRSEAAGALLFLFCRVFLFLPFFGLRFQFDAHVIVHPSILFIPVPYSL